MNQREFRFSSLDFFYLISDNKFFRIVSESDYPELTTEQFIQLFDKKETELDKWLKETKAKNLSLEELKNYVFSLCNYNQNIYNNLKGEFAKDKAQILFNQWNNPTEESKEVETEWQPKRGDIVLVWDNDDDPIERIFLAKIEGAKNPIVVVNGDYKEEFKNNQLFDSSQYEFMKPLPIEHPKETDFKSKVIELIEKRIEKRTQDLEHAVANKAYMTASTIEVVITIQNDLLNKIKQL
jgi:hypothetical protein